MKIKLLELLPIPGALAAVAPVRPIPVAAKAGRHVCPDRSTAAAPSYAITCIDWKIIFA